MSHASDNANRIAANADRIRQQAKSVADRTIARLKRMSEHARRGELPPGTRITTVELMADGTIERSSRVIPEEVK